MKTIWNAALMLTLVSCTAQAQINVGDKTPEPDLPFTLTQVATFSLPWKIAFLPDGRMIVTEKVGPVWLVTQQGAKTRIENVPAVLHQGQGGMLGVFVSPHYATSTSPIPSRATKVKPRAGPRATGCRREHGEPRGIGRAVARQMPKGRGGQFGAQVAFSPDGRYLFLSSGDRQRMTPA